MISALAADRAQARKVALASRYLVAYGYQQSGVQHFVEFADALAFFVEHLPDAGEGYVCAPRLLGYAHDDESDGLTDEEREACEEATEQAHVWSVA